MKKIYSMILAVLILLSPAGLSLADKIELRDIGDSSYKMEIKKLVEDGTISGYQDASFRPKEGISRGELAKIVSVTLKLEENKDVSDRFTDVKGKWHAGYIGALYDSGIMVGISDKSFGADRNVSREELALIVLRVFDLKDLAGELALETDFQDKEDVATWSKDAVAFISELGLINGIKMEDGGSKFLPKDFAERELVAKVIYELKYKMEDYKVLIQGIIGEAMEIEEQESIPGDIENQKDKDNKVQDDKPSYESIVSQYEKQLNQLAASISQELSSLISAARSELAAGAKASDIYSEYMGYASSLEAGADSSVASILSSLASELSANGYDTSVIDSFYSQYQNAKDNAYNGIL